MGDGTMRLANFVIRNFKGISELSVTIPKRDNDRPGSADFVSIMGQNNTCKSSVLEALCLTMPEIEPAKPTPDHFPAKKEEEGPIEVELTFVDLDEHDTQQHAIRARVHDGSFRVRKRWLGANQAPDVSSFEPTKEFPTWPERDRAKSAFLAAGQDWRRLIEEYEARNGTFTQMSKAIQDALKELAVETDSPVVQEGPATWVPNPGGFSANLDAVLPKVIFVPAIRETSEEAEPRKTKSAARQIVETLFGEQLSEHQAIKKYQEAGEQVKALFEGEEAHEVVKALEGRITEKLKRFIDIKASLDFTPPDITPDLASKTAIEIIDAGLATKPEHQGHGAQRALILSLLELLAEDSVRRQTAEDQFRRKILLLIEEPEIYLHPEMCRKMRDALLTIAQSGTAQVIATTHSPTFLDLADRHDGIVILKRQEEALVCVQRTEDMFGEGRDEQRQRLRMLLDFDPSVNEVFFSGRVCLVEGDSERASLEALAQKLHSLGEIDYATYLRARRSVTIVNCRGKWTIPAFQRVLNGFSIRYRVVHDQDQEGEGGANAAILELLRNEEGRRLVHDPNFEEQLFGEEWRSDKPWRATQAILGMSSVSAGLKDFFSFVIASPLEALRAAEPASPGEV